MQRTIFFFERINKNDDEIQGQKGYENFKNKSRYRVIPSTFMSWDAHICPPPDFFSAKTMTPRPTCACYWMVEQRLLRMGDWDYQKIRKSKKFRSDNGIDHRWDGWEWPHGIEEV